MKTEQDFILKAAIALFAMEDNGGPSKAFDLAVFLNEERKRREYWFEGEKPPRD